MGVGVFVLLLCALLFQSDADTTVLLPSFVPDGVCGVCVCLCVFLVMFRSLSFFCVSWPTVCINVAYPCSARCCIKVDVFGTHSPPTSACMAVHRVSTEAGRIPPLGPLGKKLFRAHVGVSLPIMSLPITHGRFECWCKSGVHGRGENSCIRLHSHVWACVCACTYVHMCLCLCPCLWLFL
jgi:hypothetical protein